jgi:hypothetical protein
MREEGANSISGRIDDAQIAPTLTAMVFKPPRVWRIGGLLRWLSYEG